MKADVADVDEAAVAAHRSAWRSSAVVALVVVARRGLGRAGRVAPIVALLAAIVTSPGPLGAQIDFTTDVRYDTVAAVGGLYESNPLLIYHQPTFLHLLSPTRVVFADNVGGILTAVDLVTGEGWQVDDDGNEGPGEFGGRMPYVSESGGRILVAAQNGQGSIRSSEGELLEAGRYAEFPGGREYVDFPLGLLESGVLITHMSERTRPTLERQTVAQGLRAFSRDQGLVWQREFPSIEMQMERRPDGTMSSIDLGPQPGVWGDARHQTVIVYRNREPWILALEPDGSERVRAELEYDVFDAFIDADERIWVRVWARNEEKTGSYVVLDRNLERLFHVAERSVQDARGDHLVTIGDTPEDLITIHLLRRVRERVP